MEWMFTNHECCKVYESNTKDVPLVRLLREAVSVKIVHLSSTHRPFTVISKVALVIANRRARVWDQYEQVLTKA
jgi:hypothetical protein